MNKGLVIAAIFSFYSHLLRAEEPTFQWDWILSTTTTKYQDSLLFGEPTEAQSQRVDGLIDVQIDWDRWTGLFAANGQRMWSSDDSQSFDGELIIQELFWQGELDNSVIPVDVTLGKLRLDWGVGYGFRPLDIFKPYRRNPIGIQVEEGAGTALVSYFDAQGEWSVVYTDSSWTQQQGYPIEEQSQQQGIGVRRYALQNSNEWQVIAYYDDVRKGLLAGSLVTVLDQAWEFHSSAVFQRKHLSIEQGEQLSPVALTHSDDSFQVLMGLNWASSQGHNIILEYWYDDRSWGKDEWSQAFERVEALDQDTSTQSIARSYASGLNLPNLMKHNVMFHWALDSSGWSHWDWSRNSLWLDNIEPTFDLLYSPEDGGLIATQWVNYHAYDSGSAAFDVELAARLLTGKSHSLYANLSDKHMILLNLKGKF